MVERLSVVTPFHYADIPNVIYCLLLGHIGLMVPDVNAACERFEKFNVEFVKRPNDGNFNNDNPQ